MSKKKAESETKTVSLKSLGLESFEVREIHRSLIKNAPYNPRTISDEAKRKLKGILKKHGLVGTLTWNERSGNLVGGHQRLNALDALAGTSDYTLSIAVIDVDDARERELNVALNNDEAQGVWDLGKLGEILRDTTIDIVGTGFDPADVMAIFGDTMVAKADDTRFDELALQLDKMRETFKKIDNREAEGEFYFLAVFRSGAERDQFLKDNGLPLDRYQNGGTLRALIVAGRGQPSPALQADAKTQPDQNKGSAGQEQQAVS